jgi:hypothetical protein
MDFGRKFRRQEVCSSKSHDKLNVSVPPHGSEGQDNLLGFERTMPIIYNFPYKLILIHFVERRSTNSNSLLLKIQATSATSKNSMSTWVNHK